MKDFLEQIAYHKIEGAGTTYAIQTKVGKLYIRVLSDNQKYYESYFLDDFAAEKFKELTNKQLYSNKVWKIKNTQELNKIL